MKNIDNKTVRSFGDEWSKFNQEELKGEEHKYLFDAFSIASKSQELVSGAFQPHAASSKSRVTFA